MIVVRISRDGELLPCEPCVLCKKIINKFKIKKVYCS